jgi:hypothetical protein
MTTTRRWLFRLALLAAAGVVLALLATGPYQFVFGSVAGSTAARRDSPCLPGRAVEILDSPHISPAQAPSVRYNSLPPTSGPHYAFTIATGVYTSPVPDGLMVHALEHGHVAIQYAPGTARDELNALTRIAKRYGADVVLAPYPKLKAGIALTAWGRLDLLEHYDQSRIDSFVERLRGRYAHGWARPDDCPAGTPRGR